MSATRELADRAPTYSPVGGTRPDDETWKPPPGFRAFEQTVRLGSGPEFWAAASTALLAWGVKTRSGFTVVPGRGSDLPVRVSADSWLCVTLGPLRLREPVRVVAVVDRPGRQGFAYATLDGHPVSGEEAFILERADDGAVSLTLRSLTRAPRGAWRLAYPGALVAQRWYRARYRRALRPAQVTRD